MHGYSNKKENSKSEEEEEADLSRPLNIPLPINLWPKKSKGLWPMNLWPKKSRSFGTTK